MAAAVYLGDHYEVEWGDQPAIGPLGTMEQCRMVCDVLDCCGSPAGGRLASLYLGNEGTEGGTSGSDAEPAEPDEPAEPCCEVAEQLRACAAEAFRDSRTYPPAFHGGELLLAAAAAGCAAAAALMLAADPGAAEVRTADGQTAAHLAAEQGNAGALHALLAAAPDLATARDGTGLWRLPLHAAAAAGSEAAVDALLGYCTPAVASARDAQGRTALHLATLVGNLEAIELLLEAAPGTATMGDLAGDTPAHAALSAAPQHPQGAGPLQLLLAACPQCGAAANAAGATPLLLALQSEDPSFEALLEAAPQAALVPDGRGLLPLHHALTIGDLPAFRRLLAAAPQAAAAQVPLRGRHTTLLHHAVLGYGDSDDEIDWEDGGGSGGEAFWWADALTPWEEGAASGLESGGEEAPAEPNPRQLLLALAPRFIGAAVDGSGHNLLHAALVAGNHWALSWLAATPGARAAALAADADGNTPLHDAVRRQCWKALGPLLQACPEAAAARDSQGSTPLLRALFDPGTPLWVIRRLLGAGPEASGIADSLGRGPLHAVLRGARVDTSALVQLLLAAPGAQQAALAADQGGQLPLHLACAGVWVGAIGPLLAVAPEAAAARDSYCGQAPLLLAAQNSAAPLDAIQALMAAAPQAVGLARLDGLLPLHAAMGRHLGSVAVVAALVAAAPRTVAAPAPGSHGGNSLHLAVQLEDPAVLAQLLRAGVAATAAVAAVDADGRTPLLVAAEAGRTAAVRLLLEAAPGTAAVPDASGLTPVHVAATNGHEEALRLLLGCAPGRAVLGTPGGSLLLHSTVRDAHWEAALVLLEAAPHLAATVNVQGATPLHVALDLYNGWPPPTDALVRALLLAAPHVATLENEDGCSPLDLAMEWGEHALSLSRLVVQLGAPVEEVLWAVHYFPHLAVECVTAHLPLSDAQWDAVPAPCPGLGALLPAALACSHAQAAAIVARLPAADAERLRAGALALARAQRRLRAPLHASLAERILASVLC